MFLRWCISLKKLRIHNIIKSNKKELSVGIEIVKNQEKSVSGWVKFYPSLKLKMEEEV